jgi:hypothetical protein
VNGNLSFNGTLDNLAVAKCSNTDYAATISNCGGEGKGLLVKGGSGVNAATDYAIFEVEDYAGNPILRVDGKNNATYARDFWVTVNNFPDYVFDCDYSLMPLPQLENYINTNHHLPNMPAASQVEQQGLSVGEIQKQLTEKVEQLTLYQIEMNKQLELLKQQNELLKVEITQLKK